MKNIFLILLCVFGVVLLVGFQNNQQSQTHQNTGMVGDVKFSTLEPALFKKVNGEGWVLMDGRNIVGEDLADLMKIQNIPDARGVFIRGMNLGRETSTGDPDGTNRTVGSFQADQLGQHSHIAPVGDGGGGEPGKYIDRTHNPNAEGIRPAVSTKPAGGTETRPRNITLYAYIKIKK
jgi:hypothetical protein